MIARFVQDGKSIDHTPTSAVSAGDVIVVGKVIGIAKLDIAANTLGALAVEGVFDVAKEATTDTFAAGAKVYWDAVAEQITAEPNGVPMGTVLVAAAATDATARLLLNKWNQYPEDQIQYLAEAFAFDDMTDSTGATGTLNLTAKLPAGAFILGGKVVVATGFTGDTTATIQVGISGNVDAFIDGDPSVLAAATVYGPPDGIHLQTAETTVLVTVTGAADFTSIIAGAATVYIYYIQI